MLVSLIQSNVKYVYVCNFLFVELQKSMLHISHLILEQLTKILINSLLEMKMDLYGIQLVQDQLRC